MVNSNAILHSTGNYTQYLVITYNGKESENNIYYICVYVYRTYGNFPGGSDGKASTCNVGDLGSIPRSGRSPGEGNGNPLQYSCLGNPMDGGAWQTTVRGVAKSWT